MPNLHFLYSPDGDPAAPSAPAAPPVAAPAAEPPATPEESAVNWGGLADDTLDEEPVTPAPDAPVTPVTPEPAPVAPPVAPAQSPVVPPVTPPEQPALTPEQIEQQQTAQREQVLTAATGIYEREMTDEVKSALMTEPEKVLPRLMAQAMLDGANLAMARMQQSLPGVVETAARTRSQQAEAVTAFTTAHPDLAAKEHSQAVAAAIKTVKELKIPFKTQAEAMAKVAEVARSIAGLAAPGAPAEQPLAAPVAPHVPVARSRAAAAAKPAAGDNPWAKLAIDDDQDD